MTYVYHGIIRRLEGETKRMRLVLRVLKAHKDGRELTLSRPEVDTLAESFYEGLRK